MILQLRETEGDPLKKYLYTSSAVAFLFWASPALISAVTFGVCILLKTPLTLGTVLSAVTTFQVLQNLPELISLMTQTKVPFDRIQEFIRGEDQMKTIPDHASMSSKMSHGAVIREDCVLCYSSIGIFRCCRPCFGDERWQDCPGDEESVQKQNMVTLSLKQVVAYSIWRPLAINAVFAGINTIASYVGPLLIKNFVSFLSEKQDDSSYYYGLVLASIFFLSKTVESLTQRQWFFGAQRIGIQVRAALTVLIYKKSLSIKFAGPSSGTIINMINVDVERIGDFCWHIHGIWLLPIQVFLALLRYSN
ncbi:hypothetical protein LWI29_012112 [Acer saccharum]|uniref:ABC transmembrane type-1 domain-containing protein n=1 Tax=Acer saccharum TaxID=4024 RepID=A0AA39RIW8_ACESA|nr:hypothetical protein LWI29_012112 [Acer saccharum]